MITQDQRDKYQEELDKITYLLDDYQTNHEKWAVTTYINRKGQPRTKFEPVTTSRFIEPLLENKIVILMSATLPKEGQEVAIEVDSPFPVEVRPWIFSPIGRMSRKYREKSIPKLAIMLSKLKGKSLVHCHSYKVAEDINLALLALGVHPLIQTNGDDVSLNENEDVVKRWEAVHAFKTSKDPNKILLSINLHRGVDFPEPEIVNNILAVVPFPNPTDPLVKAKNEILGESWQPPAIIAEIEQAYGRINRSERLGVIEGIEVPKRTIIVDGNFSWFYKEHKNQFHKWFIDAELKYV